MTVPREGQAHPDSVEAYRKAGEARLRQGVPLQAYDLLSEGLRHFPTDVRLRQLLALSLARTGASQKAKAMLEDLVTAGGVDEETLGLLARTCKDLWAESRNPEERRHFLTLAHDHYLSAYRTFGGHWSGINAATTALLLGAEEEAGTLAVRVQEECIELSSSTTDSGELYWILATLGESALIRGEWSEAETWYREAARMGTGRWGNLGSTRRNARLILGALGGEMGIIERCLPIPPVIAFAGHLVDRPDRPTPRFPSSAEGRVREAIRERLRTVGAGFGYAAAASGGDTLFLEAMEELGGELQIVLPYNRDQFREDSVDLIPGSDWGARYDRLLGEAAEVTTASDHRLGTGSVSYEFGFHVMDGLACLRADALDAELVCMALWDGRPGDARGGTAFAVESWRRAGRRLEVLNLEEILGQKFFEAKSLLVPGATLTVSLDEALELIPGDRRPSAPPSSSEPGAVLPSNELVTPGAFDPTIVGILFADVSGFSQLNEDQLPRFVEHFLGKVAKRIAAQPFRALLTNTWGDGLYFVFQSVAEAGTFAMDLGEVIRSTSWEDYGLPEVLSLRIALHAGPAYACQDPVTGRPNFLGSNVTIAARIEPVTPPGEIYASWVFAALARSEGVEDFRCDYVGRVSLAKGYGTIPAYVVHPAISGPTTHD